MAIVIYKIQHCEVTVNLNQPNEKALDRMNKKVGIRF